MLCGRCGAELEPGNDYCRVCGVHRVRRLNYALKHSPGMTITVGVLMLILNLAALGAVYAIVTNIGGHGAVYIRIFEEIIFIVAVVFIDFRLYRRWRRTLCVW